MTPSHPPKKMSASSSSEPMALFTLHGKSDFEDVVKDLEMERLSRII